MDWIRITGVQGSSRRIRSPRVRSVRDFGIGQSNHNFLFIFRSLIIIFFVFQGASTEEIKKQYRKLSLKHHPDRGGDSKLFVAITKAHQA